MPLELPTVRIAWSDVHTARCVVCSADWPIADRPGPGVYTVRSVEWDDVPEPICDTCVGQHYPDLFEPLLAERRRFYAE